MKYIVTLVALTAMTLGIGCASLSEFVTPATIDQQAVDYAADAGVIEAGDFGGYGNLDKANRLADAVDDAYSIKAFEIEKLAEKNQLDYSVIKGTVSGNVTIARQREEQLFGETGLLSMGLTALGFGGLTGVLGLMRRRPGDITPAEMEQAVASVKGEVTQKDRQMIEIIKGVQTFMDRNPSGSPIRDELKSCLATAQSADTKQAIAAVKAGLV